MDTDDEMGRSYDSNSLYSDMSLKLDDSFFRRDSLSLGMNGGVEVNRSVIHQASHTPIPSLELPFSHVHNQASFKTTWSQLPFVEEYEEDNKNHRDYGTGPITAKRMRHNDRLKSTSVIPARVSRENRHIIQHNYRDHAFDTDDSENIKGRGGSKKNPTVSVTKKKGGVAVPFPLKLHELLEKAEDENLTHIVSWQSHGRAFVVHDPKSFVRHLMPRFFRQTKLTSFQRQLNLYGFCRLTRGPDSGGYYHELFLRGKTHLTKRMARTKIKGTGYKAATNPSNEPDFYKMPPVGAKAPLRCTASNKDDKVLAEAESNHQEVEYEHYSVDNTLQNYTTIPIVTPTNSFYTTADRNGQSDMTLNGHGSLVFKPKYTDGEVWPCFECVQPIFMCNSDSKQGISPLKPRRKSPLVRMGNQSFRYIDSLNFDGHDVRSPTSCDSEDSFYRSKLTSDVMNDTYVDVSPFSCSEGSTIGDISVSMDENSIQCDPLDIFLEEMGDEYDEDINAFPIDERGLKVNGEEA